MFGNTETTECPITTCDVDKRISDGVWLDHYNPTVASIVSITKLTEANMWRLTTSQSVIDGYFLYFYIRCSNGGDYQYK